jgi:cell division protein FtsW
VGTGDGRPPDRDSDADEDGPGPSTAGTSDAGSAESEAAESEAAESEAAERAAARRRHPTARRPAQRSVMQSPLFVGLAFLVAVFNLLGLVMVLSASSVHAHTEYGSSWYFVSRQALWTTVGVVALVLVARLDYHRLRRWASPMLLISLVTLVLVVIPGVGVEVHGARRWLGTGSFSVQPSEFAKLALLIWTADLLARRASMVRRLQASLVPVLVALGAVALLIMLQPNLGTTIVVVGMILGVCFVAGVPMAPMAGVGGVLAALAAVLAVVEPYRRSRLVGFWDPWDDPLGEGYQSIQSMVGLASGGVAGTGLGASRAKWGFLPFAHTDFVFAIIGEELGLIGALMVVALFVLLGVLGVRTALHASDRFGMLLAVGITAWFLLQAFINIGAVIGVLPVTGVPLPFVSFGGSSLVVNMVGVGLLLSVARQAVLPARRAAGDSPENVQRDGGHE